VCVCVRVRACVFVTSVIAKSFQVLLRFHFILPFWVRLVFCLILAMISIKAVLVSP